MKKWIPRIISAVCILASLALVFYSTCVKVDGVKRKDFREYRSVFIDDLENVKEQFLWAYETSENFEDDLDDNDLPSTKGSIKNRFRKAETIIEETFNDEISFKEIYDLAVEAPRFITDTENLLYTEICAERIFDASDYVYEHQVEDIVGEAVEYKFVFYLIIAFFVLVAVIALGAVVTQLVNKFKFFKFLYWAVLVLVVVGICVVLPVASAGLAETLGTVSAFEDLTLKITAMPFVAITLATVPIVLDIIIFIKSKKEKGTK